MSLNRRDFVATVGLSLVGSAVSRTATAKQAAAIPAVDGNSDWAAVRAQFDLDPDWMHFSQFYIVSHPKPVRAAIERLRHRLDQSPFATVEHGMGFDVFLGEEASRTSRIPSACSSAAASYVGGKPEEIALTDSTTQGLALVYQGLEAQAGRRDPVHDARSLRASRGDSPRGGEVGRELAARAAVRRFGDRFRRRDGRDLKRAIGPKTRVVGITWVHSSSGVKIPARALTQVVAEANAGRGEKDEHPGRPRRRARLRQPGRAGREPRRRLRRRRHAQVDLRAARHGHPLGAREELGPLRPTIPTFYDIEPYAAWENDRPPNAPTSISWISPGGFKAFEHQWAMGDAFEFHEASAASASRTGSPRSTRSARTAWQRSRR